MSYDPGINHPQAKFTEDEIRTIRAAHAEYQRLKKEMRELSPKVMAEKMEIDRSTYWEIVSYTSYRNVL